MATPNLKQVFGFLVASALGGTAVVSAVNANAGEDRTVCGATIVLPQTKEDFDALASMTPDEQKEFYETVNRDGAERARGFALDAAVHGALESGKKITINSLNKKTNCYHITLQ
jgi:hypothetical protein